MANKITFELPCSVGDTVYFAEEDSHNTAEIEQIILTADTIKFYWVQYDRGPDETEVWDEGYFTKEDIGKSVFLSFEEMENHIRPCIRGIKCEYEYFDYSDNVTACEIGYDGADCPKIPHNKESVSNG